MSVDPASRMPDDELRAPAGPDPAAGADRRRGGPGRLRGRLAHLARRVLPRLPGGLCLLGRDHAGLPGPDDAPPPGGRRLGPADPPADGVGRRSRCCPWRSCSCRSPSTCRSSTSGRGPRRSRTTRSSRPRATYLNPALLPGPHGAYFVVWIVLALLVDRLSAAQDRSDDHGPSRWLGALSGPGLILLFLTGSFAAIDWMMTLEPHWVSSIYGAMVVVGEGLATLAMMVADRGADVRPPADGRGGRRPAGCTTWAT